MGSRQQPFRVHNSFVFSYISFILFFAFIFISKYQYIQFKFGGWIEKLVVCGSVCRNENVWLKALRKYKSQPLRLEWEDKSIAFLVECLTIIYKKNAGLGEDASGYGSSSVVPAELDDVLLACDEFASVDAEFDWPWLELDDGSEDVPAFVVELLELDVDESAFGEAVLLSAVELDGVDEDDELPESAVEFDWPWVELDDGVVDDSVLGVVELLEFGDDVELLELDVDASALDDDVLDWIVELELGDDVELLELDVDASALDDDVVDWVVESAGVDDEDDELPGVVLLVLVLAWVVDSVDVDVDDDVDVDVDEDEAAPPGVD